MRFNVINAPRTVHLRRLRRLAALFTRKHGITGAVSIVFLPLTTMRRLNHEYRGKAAATDVLAFDLRPLAPMPANDREAVWAEIALCLPKIRERSRREGGTTDDQCRRLVIHAMYHFLGHHHASDRAARRMEALERGMLGRI